jgi:hypothetical protein
MFGNIFAVYTYVRQNENYAFARLHAHCGCTMLISKIIIIKYNFYEQCWKRRKNRKS